MPQLQLAISAAGLTAITNDIAFQRENGKVVYFHGHLPVFQHEEKDVQSFRLFTSQLIANGTVRQTDIVQAFRVPLATVKRYMKVHRQYGAEGFFRQRRRRGATVLPGEVQHPAPQFVDDSKTI